MHELIEMFLTKHRGIAEAGHQRLRYKVRAIAQESNSSAVSPAITPKAPYRSEHFFATNLERLFSSELGVDWFEYDRDVDALGIKK